MKSSLIVDGKYYPITKVTIETESGVERTFYDAEIYSFMDDIADFEKALTNPAEKKEYIQRIENTIYETREYLKDLKVQVANIVIENFDLPFPDIALAPLVEEIKSTVAYLEGLECALEVLKGGE